MPFYSCVFRSLAPETDALARAEDGDGGQRSSLYLLSRLIRENACLWISTNLKPIALGIKNLQASQSAGQKVTIDAWRLMPHLRVAFSLFVEIVAAADLADESLVGMKMYDHILDMFSTCTSAINDKKELDKAMFMNGWAHDLLAILREKDEPLFAKRICSPIVWYLWGQALIKIARNYLIPSRQGQESEASKNHHNALYQRCLDVSATKFQKCDRLVAQLRRNNSQPPVLAVLNKMNAECAAALGHVMLSKAREQLSMVSRERQLNEARSLLRRAYWLDAQSPCLYNLACVASLNGQPHECRSYLQLAAKAKLLPPLLHVFHDPDLDPMRSLKWFPSFLEVVPNEKPSTDYSWLYSTDIGMSILDSMFAMPEPTTSNLDSFDHLALHIPKMPDADSTKIETQNSVGKVTTTKMASSPTAASNPKNDPFNGLTESMYFDESLNRLQASLTRDGFSRSTVVSMLKEVHKQKKADKAQNERFEAAHSRLMLRLEAAGMKQKSVIPGDGNCQFHSISDQLFDSLEQSAWVRAQIVAWLKSHGEWVLPENGAQLKDFAYEDWDVYCANMARPGIWGDHLTLTAAANLFGVRIVLFSSIEDNHYVTEYLPSVITSPKVLYLCHYAEYHYGSVCRKEPEEVEAQAQADQLAKTILIQDSSPSTSP